MSETVAPTADDVRADLEAALAASEKAEPPVEREAKAPPSPKAEKPPPPEPDEPEEKLVPPEGDRPRDQFGRFTKTLTEPEEAPSEKDAEPAEEPASDQPATKAAEPATQPAIAPPQSWSAAAKDEWVKLPRAVQDEVLKRESDVARGFQQRAEQINSLEPIAQVVAPHAQKFALRGVHPAQVVQQLLAVQDLLERDPLEGVAYVARSYGVDLRQFAAALQQSAQPQNPEVQAANSRIDRMEQFLQQTQAAAQQAEMARITSEIEAFKSDGNHPYFDAVRPAMAQLMQSNIAMTLQDAYDHATWALPEVRARLLEDQRRAEQSQRAAAEKQAAERARRAAVSVSSAPTSGKGGPPTKERSVREELEAQLERAASR